MQRRKPSERRSNENAHSPSFIGKSVLQSRLSAGIFRALSLARSFLGAASPHFLAQSGCGCPRVGFCWRRVCPSCRGGHLLSLRGESKQRLAKGHLWNPFGEQVLECNAESHRKGAPMKMPTLRVSSGNQSCCPVCRRAFSERSRQLGVFLVRLCCILCR